jgi:hypothetical protein
MLHGNNMVDQQQAPAGDRTHLGLLRPTHIWSVEDGRAPKRSLTPYMLFVKERKYELMVENPSMPFGKMM